MMASRNRPPRIICLDPPAEEPRLLTFAAGVVFGASATAALALVWALI